MRPLTAVSADLEAAAFVLGVGLFSSGWASYLTLKVTFPAPTFLY